MHIMSDHSELTMLLEAEPALLAWQRSCSLGSRVSLVLSGVVRDAEGVSDAGTCRFR